MLRRIRRLLRIICLSWWWSEPFLGMNRRRLRTGSCDWGLRIHHGTLHDECANPSHNFRSSTFSYSCPRRVQTTTNSDILFSATFEYASTFSLPVLHWTFTNPTESFK